MIHPAWASSKTAVRIRTSAQLWALILFFIGKILENSFFLFERRAIHESPGLMNRKVRKSQSTIWKVASRKSLSLEITDLRFTEARQISSLRDHLAAI